MGKPRILIDVNVILDTLQKREPFYESSARVLASVETGQAEGVMAAHTVTTLFYLITKDSSSEQARATLTDLMQFLTVAAVDQVTIEEALNLSCRDLEDAVQMMAAVHCGAEYVVTRNVHDYESGPLPALRPGEFLALLSGRSST